jgi:hypothetical protein
MVVLILELLACVVGILSAIVVIMGFMYFEEWEIGVEFLPIGYNSFELGISNRNYPLDDGGLEQELRIGLLLFSFIILFRRFGA